MVCEDDKDLLHSVCEYADGWISRIIIILTTLWRPNGNQDLVASSSFECFSLTLYLRCMIRSAYSAVHAMVVFHNTISTRWWNDTPELPIKTGLWRGRTWRYSLPSGVKESGLTVRLSLFPYVEVTTKYYTLPNYTPIYILLHLLESHVQLSPI